MIVKTLTIGEMTVQIYRPESVLPGQRLSVKCECRWREVGFLTAADAEEAARHHVHLEKQYRTAGRDN